PPPTPPLFPYTTLFRSLPAVINFERRSHHEAAIVNRKSERVEKPAVFLVEWNVEENTLLVGGRHALPVLRLLLRRPVRRSGDSRSEEHTSELQSLAYLV